jgi:hypothetical protein
MTQEEKELLVKDLCARQLYGVKLYVDGNVKTLLNIEQDVDRFNQHKIYYTVDFIDDYGNFNFCSINEIKPYLRQLSSMTEEERKDFEKAARKDIDIALNEVNRQHKSKLDQYAPLLLAYNKFDWLNAHHFDYRGLIQIGLALEAPKDMYNKNTKDYGSDNN